MPSLYGAGVLALVVRHASCAYKERSGYVHGDGGEIVSLPAEIIDLPGAKAKCDANAECKAISYAGSAGTPKVYYKNTMSPFYNDCWKSYAKASQYAQPANGFLPAGDELGVASSLNDAKTQCNSKSACAGFSVRETDDKFYLKGKYTQPHHDCWTTLEKTAEQANEPKEEAPNTYYGGEQATAYGGGDESSSPYYGGTEEASSPYYGGSEEASAPSSAYYGATESSSAPTYYS